MLPQQLQHLAVCSHAHIELRHHMPVQASLMQHAGVHTRVGQQQAHHLGLTMIHREVQRAGPGRLHGACRCVHINALVLQQHTYGGYPTSLGSQAECCVPIAIWCVDLDSWVGQKQPQTLNAATGCDGATDCCII
eukprot:CAMPEP_0202889838 /NCGR_PEP_ID=MMETSP1392-20130828/396_1 /ASSEMBLY_ACC=CAM_ASM_000868 /TAXON_ID=225041 /ORGANISM="Chlamydomonas chlamydogama, Strain SAG 11-48b" /LENGTH=134 /DNA_ID=CAMNT_0049573261 /DNA_START=90 /DNA_END=494 /DNA_ORIENTATION=-